MENAQAIENAARIALLGKGHIPQISHCPTLSFLYTYLLSQLLAIDEGEHAFHIVTLCLAECLQRCQQLLRLRTDEMLEELILHVALIQRIGRQLGLDMCKSLMGYLYLLCHYLIAQTDSLVKKLLVIVDYQQSLFGRIARVEQTDVHLISRKMEIIAKNAVVEQQLNVVRLGIGYGGFMLQLPVLTRFLLHQQVHILCHQINTPLQS